MATGKKKKTWFRASTISKGVGEVRIMSDIGDYGVTAMDFHNAVQALGPLKTLNLFISSNGGDVSVGTAIYNMLKRMDARVIATVDGLAASMASVIFMAADERIMPENSMLMIHNPWGGVVGEADQIIAFGEGVKVMQENLVQAYVDRSGLSAAKVQAMMNRETWLSAARSVELGLADRVEDAQRMAAKIDIGKFNRAPKSLRAAMESVTMKHSKKTRADLLSEFEADDEANGKTPEEIRAEVRAHDKEVRALCALADFPELAQGFIDEEKTLDEVRAALTEAKAEKAKGKGKSGKSDSEVNAHRSNTNGEELQGRTLDPAAAFKRFNNPPSTKR